MINLITPYISVICMSATDQLNVTMRLKTLLNFKAKKVLINFSKF